MFSASHMDVCVFCSGLLAKKAVEAGLTVKPYIRTSLVPGSGTVTHYLNTSGVLPFLRKLGYTHHTHNIIYTHLGYHMKAVVKNYLIYI